MGRHDEGSPIPVPLPACGEGRILWAPAARVL
jgi:hypothetical protein